MRALHRGRRYAATFARASAAAAALTFFCACTSAPPLPAEPSGLAVRSPRLPVTETIPASSSPKDPVKKGILDRINSDRAAAGLTPVAWDEAASRVADEYCEAQVAEGTRGHFLTNGVPPYARTSFAGISGMGSENSVAWITTAPAFEESPLALGLSGHEDMMRETPPNDGHRKAILDPEATHVGVGWAMKGGSFRMAEEFLTRKLASLTLNADGGTLIVSGRTVSGQTLQFVTIAFEEEPKKISKEEARSRTIYIYPEPRYALVAEGRKFMRVVGVDTDDAIRVGGTGDFFFRWAPPQAGLWTMVFYMAEARERPRPGGLAVFWIVEASRK